MVEVARSSHGQVRSMSVVGGWESFPEQVLDPVMDIHFLATKQQERIRNSFVCRYDTLSKFRFVVEKQDMVDWLVKLEIYDSYQRKFPELIGQIRDLMAASEPEADILFSTVHKAKGLGWPSVLLLNDFLSHPRGEEISEEEVNICYVALSRVSTNKLFLTFDPCKKASRALHWLMR